MNETKVVITNDLETADGDLEEFIANKGESHGVLATFSEGSLTDEGNWTPSCAMCRERTPFELPPLVTPQNDDPDPYMFLALQLEEYIRIAQPHGWVFAGQQVLVSGQLVSRVMPFCPTCGKTLGLV